VSCDFTDSVLHGYLDGELDVVRAAEFEGHLERCSDCVAALKTQESLRSSINRAQLYAKAPALFRAKIVSELGAGAPTKLISRRNLGSWLALAAALVVVAYAGWRVRSGALGDAYQNVLAAQIVDAHLRALQPGHLTDVVSSDQHTVKPWFDGRLDFSPPVRDFTNQGFPLQGGRLDIVHGRSVAALVYGRHKHLVSVFIWPVAEKDTGPRWGSQQGYQWVHWRKSGMQFWAVSDAALDDLQQLQRLLAD